MADKDVYLGRQVFSFNESGALTGIAAAEGDRRNTVFYDEEDKYYVDGMSKDALLYPQP